MLLTRTLSALVLAPIAVAAILLGGWILIGLLAIGLGLAAWEYVRLMRQGGYQPVWWVALILIVVLLIDPAQSATLPTSAELSATLTRLAPAVVSLVLLGSLTWHLGHRSATVTADWALAVAGGIYLGWAGRQFVQIRAFDNGAAWLLLVLAGVWLADTGAYLIGVRWGRHKMTPALSPKKSWEGLMGGSAAGLIGNGLLAAVLGLPAIHGVALGLLGATIGTLGDLAISMIKRQVGAKDSGQLIPGHGGALDRVDSLLFAVIAGQLYLVWIAGLPAAS
ncbi:MAG TPA: phosphatidate cytidylyltransferase [Anaerolineae bacterium]|nr:phosphatidate cytidylyltransferase [Anaerolineae bacterium]